MKHFILQSDTKLKTSQTLDGRIEKRCYMISKEEYIYKIMRICKQID